MKPPQPGPARQTRWPLGAAVLILVSVSALPSGWKASRSAPRPPAAPSSPAIAPPHASVSARAADAAVPLATAASNAASTREDPLAPRDRSYGTIAALQREGRFEAAADYAVADSGAWRRDLIIAAFHDWGRQQPDSAVSAALRVNDAAARRLAFASALSGWARIDPAGLAGSALAFPDGPEKDSALTKALRAWLVADPEQAGDWIAAHPATLAVAEKMIRDDRR